MGGWWNYGGILREVYLRRVQGIDFASVQVSPRLSCATCAAVVSYSVVLSNSSPSAERVELRTSYGGTIASLGRRTIGAGSSATYTARLRIASPVLWSPASPHLYQVTLDASAGGRLGGAAHRRALHAGERDPRDHRRMAVSSISTSSRCTFAASG